MWTFAPQIFVIQRYAPAPELKWSEFNDPQFKLPMVSIGDAKCLVCNIDADDVAILLTKS